MISEWTTCSKTCATGTQTRTIKCIVAGGDGTDKVQDDGQCTTKPTDPVQQSCNAKDCNARYLVKSDYGAVSGFRIVYQAFSDQITTIGGTYPVIWGRLFYDRVKIE